MSRADTTTTPGTIVRASAGSGKTYKLTNAFMSRLLAGEEPGSMLATTFTRVAAGEILHRVLDRLSGAVVDEDKLSELAEALEDKKLTQDRCATVLKDLVSQLHRLSIMTIDSFFARLAGSYCFELGLPMNYRLLEEDEDEELRARCVDHTIEACSRAEMVELLRSMQGDRVQMRTHSAIMKAIKNAYAMYLATDGDRNPWDSFPVVGKQLGKPEIETRLDQLAQCQMPLTKSGTPNKNWAKAHARGLQSIKDGDWFGLVQTGLGKPMLAAMDATEVPTYSRIEFPEELIGTLLPLIEHARYEISADHNRRTKAVWDMMHRFDSVYRDAKMTGGQLTFDDPPRLLNESRVTGDLEHLYYRLDTTLRHVMLDEFQDTSMPQFKLLEPILDELLSQNEEERSVFVVGDVKQSLYTWRHAEPTLLGAMQERWATLTSQTLAESYRSSPIVLDAVNSIFGDLPQNDAMMSSEPAQDAARAWHEQYDWHKSARTEMPGYVSLCVAHADEQRDPDEKPDDTDEVLWSCAMRVHEARSQSAGASIAVLVRKTKDIYPLLSMLKKLGVDACENRGNPLIDAPSVAAAVSMLELIEHPGNSAALHHVRSTPLAAVVGIAGSGGIGMTASSLRDRISRDGCVPMLTDWLKGCADSMDQRGMIRFEQLIELAARLEGDGRTGAGVLSSVAQSRRIDEPGHAPVRVMTIHSSKGLEFDVVVLPLLGFRAWNVNHENLLAHRDTPLGAITRVSRYPREVLRLINPELGDLYHNALLKQINEELCCLYVATTRAKRSLQMVIPSGNDGRKGNPVKTLAAKSQHVVQESLAPGAVCEPGAVLYEHQSKEHWASGLNEGDTQPTPVQTRPIALRVQAPAHIRASALKPAAPSALHDESDGNGVDLGTLLSDDAFGLEAREHGLCVHTAFEQFDWLGIDRDQLTDSMNLKPFSEQSIGQAIDEVMGSIDCPPIARLLSENTWLEDHPSAGSTRVHHERPFAIRLNEGDEERLVQGRFDRLVLGIEHEKITCVQIVDYKTDRAVQGMGASKLKEHAKKHRAQVDAYRRAVAKMYTLDLERVEAVLVFTRCPGIVNLTTD